MATQYPWNVVFSKCFYFIDYLKKITNKYENVVMKCLTYKLDVELLLLSVTWLGAGPDDSRAAVDTHTTYPSVPEEFAVAAVTVLALLLVGGG